MIDASVVQNIIDEGIEVYPDHKGRVWAVVRYGDIDEGIKVETIEDGVKWQGWITYNDALLYATSKIDKISVCWQSEV